jgi:DNA-directed RNA polymerase subunit M
MEFCPKCGAVLVQKKKNMGCPRCGYSSKGGKGKGKMTTSEKMREHEKIGIVSDKGEEPLPVVAVDCRKCGNERAYFWTVQTRSGDEAETKFFKCTKCGNTTREYR